MRNKQLIFTNTSPNANVTQHGHITPASVVLIGTLVVLIGTLVVLIGTLVVLIGTLVVLIGTLVVLIGTLVVLIETLAGLIGTWVGSARLIRFQHVGIVEVNGSYMRGFSFWWNIG